MGLKLSGICLKCNAPTDCYPVPGRGLVFTCHNCKCSWLVNVNELDKEPPFITEGQGSKSTSTSHDSDNSSRTSDIPEVARLKIKTKK